MTDANSQPARPGLKGRNLAGLLLIALGLTAMAGDLLGSLKLKGLGAVSCAAPFPKVFSDMDGVEGYACRFALQAVDAEGGVQDIPIDPKLYAKLKGPYNRRNVYGAALAGAPFLPETIWRPVHDYALAHDGPLFEEFEIPAAAAAVRVRIVAQTQGRQQAWSFLTPCRK